MLYISVSLDIQKAKVTELNRFYRNLRAYKHVSLDVPIRNKNISFYEYSYSLDLPLSAKTFNIL